MSASFPASEVARDSATETILVLLNNRENGMLLGEVLRSAGYGVINEFPSGCESALDASAVDLCIVDGPSLDTQWEKLRATQAAQQQPLPLPVLLMTDRSDVGLATRDLWHVVDDVVHKPVDKLALRARIETLIRGRRLALQVRRLSHLYEHERRVARRFQEAAMPRALPEMPGISFSAVYRPATSEERVGGDWYDAVRLPDGRVVLSIGDVCGFGLDAAVAMAKVRQVVRGVAQIHPDPATMLDAADRTLQAEDQERIVTAFVAVLDPVTSLITFASAGHPRPILRFRDGTLTELAASGLPLGLPMLASARATETIELPPDALLVLYTDGVTEATHDLLAGEERLRSVVARGAILDAPNVAEALHAALLPGQSSDDVAILTIATSATPLGPEFLSRWSFDAGDRAAAVAVRNSYTAELERRGVCDDDRYSAQLIFAELLGNVVRHAPGIVDVALDWASPTPVLHILDRGNGFRYYPKLPADLLSECGRGLFIISSLAQEFAVSERPGGGCHARALLPHRPCVADLSFRPADAAETSKSGRMSYPSGERDGLRAVYADAIALFRQDTASAELLAAIPASAWIRSGCMAFASALQECLGGTLMSIGWYALLADHVVLKFDGMFLDAEGAYTEPEILEKYSSLARAPLALWPLTNGTVTPPAGAAQQRAALAARLATYLPTLLETRKVQAVGKSGAGARVKGLCRK